MANSQNGYTLLNGTDLNRSNFPGSSAAPVPGVRQGDAGFVLLKFGEQFNKRVEKLVKGWCWGYARPKRIGGLTSAYSNHGSGTAIDLNAPRHPYGKANTFTKSQRAEIQKLLKEFDGVIRWLGNTQTKDDMHFEIIASPQKVSAVARKLRNINVPKPKPAAARKSNETIAKEVVAGKWGNGSDRVRRLSKAGYNPNAIQSIVNKLISKKPAKKKVKKSDTTIAREVIAGKWGNGAVRIARLKKAGYNYKNIQAKVNQLLRGR